MSEFDSQWHISSFSGGANCLEAIHQDGLIRLRHSSDRDGVVLTFTGPEWMAFVRGVRKGEFDIPEPCS